MWHYWITLLMLIVAATNDQKEPVKVLGLTHIPRSDKEKSYYLLLLFHSKTTLSGCLAHMPEQARQR